MQNYLNKKQLMDIMQVTSANFPIGTFSHSFGLETFIRQNDCLSSIELKKIIKSYILNTLVYNDMLAIREVFLHLKNKQFSKIYEIDNLLNISTLSKESRDSFKKISSQMIKLYLEIYPDFNLLKNYKKSIQEGKCCGHPAIIYAYLCWYLKINYVDCFYSYLFSTCSNLIQNCVRAIPLGQIEGQKLIFEVKKYFDKAFSLVEKSIFEKEFCKNFPHFEIKQMQHEKINVRLFMS